MAKIWKARSEKRATLIAIATTIDWTTHALWLAVVASGIYHGLNPGMGWPLAVSAGLSGRGRQDLIGALGPLAGGHFLAMAGVLLPFGLMTLLVDWQREIRIVAALAVIAVGIWLFFHRRHQHVPTGIGPAQLAFWSFAVATAHGAGLMLVPIYLGLCRVEELDAGHQAALTLMAGNITQAIAVSVVHASVMILSGGLLALAVHHWLGPRFVATSWARFDVFWSVSLVAVGIISLTSALELI
jgi:hypothetical protein